MYRKVYFFLHPNPIINLHNICNKLRDIFSNDYIREKISLVQFQYPIKWCSEQKYKLLMEFEQYEIVLQYTYIYSR